MVIDYMGADLETYEIPFYNSYPMTSKEQDVWLEDNFPGWIDSKKGKFKTAALKQFDIVNTFEVWGKEEKRTNLSMEDGFKFIYKDTIEPELK